MEYVIGQTPSPTHGNSSAVLISSLLLIAFLVFGFVAVAVVKKWLRGSGDEGSNPRTGFTLSDLRQMKRDGQITDEEYERARDKIVGIARAAKPAPPDMGPNDLT